MKGTTYKRCACKGPDGRPLNQRCPDLPKRRHGTWTLDTRLDTTDRDGRRLKRGGYPSQTSAQTALDHIGDLIKLARDDDGMRRRIGDLIFEKSKRGGELPDVDEARRRLGAGGDIAAPSVTVAQWLEEWYAGKRAKKLSTRVKWRHHMDHYLIPLLGDLPRDRLRPEHISSMCDTIEEWNTEIAAARAEGRKPYLPDDTRQVHKPVGISTQHLIVATLRNAYNVALRQGMVSWNPCLAVELPPVHRDPARVWSPEQVATFLRQAEGDRIGLLYRIVLLRGLRRGEACGLRWEDYDAEHRRLRVAQAILEIGAHVVVDTPKSKKSGRWVSLDTHTAELLAEHRKRQRREKFAAGEAYQDGGLIFCEEDGTPLRPSRVTYHFRRILEEAGLPVIKLHEGRHTAASLALEAGLDIKVVSDQLGHSTTSITHDLYTHVRPAVHDDAAERVARLLPEQARGVGS